MSGKWSAAEFVRSMEWLGGVVSVGTKGNDYGMATDRDCADG